MAGRRINLDMLGKFLPQEVLTTLRGAPTMDELSMKGQGELPFPEGPPDYLPQEFVEQERVDQAIPALRQSGLLDELFGPVKPTSGGPSQYELPGLRQPLPESLTAPIPATTPRQPLPWEPPAGETNGPLWNGQATRTEGNAGMQTETLRKIQAETTPPTKGQPPVGFEDKLSASEWDIIYGKAGVPVVPEGRAKPSTWAQRDQWERATKTRSNWTPSGKPEMIASPDLEEAVRYGQDYEALPPGRYEYSELPEGGRRAEFVPQEQFQLPFTETDKQTNQAIDDEGFRLEQERNRPVGVEIPSLSGLKRRVEDITGEGVAQDLPPTKVPWDEPTESLVQQVELNTGISREELQPVWDRISAAQMGNPQGARREFIEFNAAILETARNAEARGLDPVRAAQAHFREIEPIARGTANVGFGDRRKASDKAWMAQQAEDFGIASPKEGFRGSEFDAEAREEFDPRGRTFDVAEEAIPGQRPLQAMAKKPGLTDDPVENFLNGSADMGVVPRGALQPGKQLVQSGGAAPREVEVLKVIPLRGKPGYLKALSERTGIPTRTLQVMIDSGEAFDVVQVRRPSGTEGPALPPEGRWRNPEDLQFRQDARGAGGRQAEKFAADPLMTEKFLQKPGARIMRASEGAGTRVFGVVRQRGKDGVLRTYAVVERNGKKVADTQTPVEKRQVTDKNGRVTEKLYYGDQLISAGNLEKDPTRGEQLKEFAGITLGEPGDKASRRSSIGRPIPREKLAKRLKSPAFTGEARPIEVEGLQLAPQPIRSDFSKVKFNLVGEAYQGKGGTGALPPQAQNPKAAELTLVFSPRNRPSAISPEFAELPEAGVRELHNPSLEDLREVLSRSNISKVAVRVEEGFERGPAQNTWERVKALLKEVKKPSPQTTRKPVKDPETGKWYLPGKGKALAGAGALIGATLLGEEEASAAPAPSKSWQITKALREAGDPPSPGDQNLLQSGYTSLIDQFEPVYRALKEKIGTDTPLRHVLQTEWGGGAGKAEVELEPTRLALQDMERAGLSEEFSQYLTWNQGLRTWDLLERRRDNYLIQASNARTAGRFKDEKKYLSKVESLDATIANATAVEQGLRKEDLSAFMEDLRARVGEEKFRQIQTAAEAPYAAVQQKLDELYTNGLLPEETYREYKARGTDHIPSWKTPYEVDAEGNVTWKGDNYEASPLGTSLQVREEQLLQELFGSQGVTKDPLENAATFITRAEQELNRNAIARAVAKQFEGVGVAIRHATAPDKVTPGNKLYTFMDGGKQTIYEMPAYLVDTLALVDKNLSRKLLQNIPGGGVLRALRAIPEAGVTTANLGFGLSQSAMIDPITAIIQNDWRQGPLKGLAPYARVWFRELLAGFGRENQSLFGVPLVGMEKYRESTPLRKEAAKNKVLYAGATSQVLDPRDVLGNKGLSRAKEAFQKGDYVQAANETVGGVLSPFTQRIMKPLEEANKLASYSVLKNQGASELEAAYEARKFGGSPDWAQTGSWDHALRFFVTFGRPALLGVEAAIRSGQRNPKRLAAVMGGSLAMEVARQSLVDQTAQELGITAEEAENRFSDYDRDNTFLVMIPPSVAQGVLGTEGPMEVLSNGIERPYAFKIPIPPILRLYTSPFKGVAKALRPKGSPLDVPLAVADEMIPGTVPLESGNLASTALRRVGASLPAPLRIPAEQITGKQFFTGAPVVGSRLEGLPETEQFTESTEPVYKSAARALKGVPYLSSPARLQHIGKGFLPGAFEIPGQLLNALDTPDVPPVAKGETETLAQTPILGPMLLRRFMPQRYESELGDLQDDFYGLAESTKAAAGARNRFAKGIGMEPSTLVQELGAANPVVAGVMRGLAQISTAQKQIVNSPDMDPEAKRAAMRELVTTKREILRQFLSEPTIQLLLEGQTQE